uniref:Uncharacterized protein n=1 Tax=Serratia marcescens TaxID=615 RepID=A0A9X8YPF7_SERMA
MLDSTSPARHSLTLRRHSAPSILCPILPKIPRFHRLRAIPHTPALFSKYTKNRAVVDPDSSPALHGFYAFLGVQKALQIRAHSCVFLHRVSSAGETRYADKNNHAGWRG